MKKKIQNSLLGMMMFLAGIPAFTDEAPNMVKNPSFEIINQNTGLPENWSTLIRQGKGKNANCQFSVSRKAQDGNSAVAISVPDQEKTGAIAEFCQLVSVKPRTKYYFAVYMETPAYVNAWPCAFAEERTSDKGYPKYSTTSSHQALSAEKVIPDQYQLFETAFTTGADTFFINVSLRLQNLGSGSVQFDNVILLEQPE